MKKWKLALINDDSANVVIPTLGSKRKAVCSLKVYLLVNV